MVYLAVFRGGAAGILWRGGIFFGVMVGGVGGVSGPKELMGLVDAVTDDRSYPQSGPRSAEVEALVFTTCRIVYYESTKRELTVELEHLKIETRLTIDKFASAMGEYVTERW
jgi:hypothetical protein